MFSQKLQDAIKDQAERRSAHIRQTGWTDPHANPTQKNGCGAKPPSLISLEASSVTSDSTVSPEMSIGTQSIIHMLSSLVGEVKSCLTDMQEQRTDIDRLPAEFATLKDRVLLVLGERSQHPLSIDLTETSNSHSRTEEEEDKLVQAVESSKEDLLWALSYENKALHGELKQQRSELVQLGDELLKFKTETLSTLREENRVLLDELRLVKSSLAEVSATAREVQAIRESLAQITTVAQDISAVKGTLAEMTKATSTAKPTTTPTTTRNMVYPSAVKTPPRQPPTSSGIANRIKELTFASVTDTPTSPIAVVATEAAGTRGTISLSNFLQKKAQEEETVKTTTSRIVKASEAATSNLADAPTSPTAPSKIVTFEKFTTQTKTPSTKAAAVSYAVQAPAAPLASPGTMEPTTPKKSKLSCLPSESTKVVETRRVGAGAIASCSNDDSNKSCSRTPGKKRKVIVSIILKPHTSSALYKAQRKDKALRDYLGGQTTTTTGMNYPIKNMSIHSVKGQNLVLFHRKLYIPAALRQETMEYFFTKHSAYSDAYADIHEHCIWPSLEEDVLSYHSNRQ